MEKPKFKIGDTIVSTLPRKGIEEAVVANIDSKNYYLKIMRGIGIVPISSQVLYKLKEK